MLSGVTKSHNNILEFVDYRKDVPCKIVMTQYCSGNPCEPSIHFRTDPTSNDGWVNCDPLGIYVGIDKMRVKKMLVKQGFYKKFYVADDGELLYTIEVYKQEEII